MKALITVTPAVLPQRLLRVVLMLMLVAAYLPFSSLVKAEELSPEIEQLINDRVEQRVNEALKGGEFDNRVEQVILNFIKKSEQAQVQQKRSASQIAAKNVAKVNVKTDYIRGNPDAEFSLIEYSDYECPYCKRFHATASALINNNPEVNWVYRHFPLGFHNPGAQKEAEAAECAGYLGGNDTFWSYTDLIYQRTRSNGKGFPISNLVPLATELGLDKQKFEQCLNSGQFRNKVLSQFQNGQISGVNGTPGNFLRHRATGLIVSIQGAQPLATLEDVLAQLKAQISK